MSDSSYRGLGGGYTPIRTDGGGRGAKANRLVTRNGFVVTLTHETIITYFICIHGEMQAQDKCATY